MNLNKKIFILIVPILFLSSVFLEAQVVTSEENSEAYLKEFDMYSFKDAGIKIKDSTVLFQHLFGVKYGYAISSVMFSNTKSHKSYASLQNYGVYYTYFHSLLGTMPFFGFQTGISRTQLGYVHVTKSSENSSIETPQIYNALELPLSSVFRADMNWMRLMLGIGGWGYYIYDTELPNGIPSTTNIYGFGLLGQAGIAIKLHPVELHLEANYKYGLTEFLDPKIYSEDYWTYTHATQLQFSAGLFINFGSKHYKKRK